MANNYTAFSVAIGELSEKTQEFVESLIEKMASITDGESYEEEQTEDVVTAAAQQILGAGEGWTNSYELEGNVLFVSHDETGDVDQAVAFMQEVLRFAEDDRMVTMEWANYCDKPRPGEFGGGAVVFNRHGARWLVTAQWASKMEADLVSGDEKFIDVYVSTPKGVR